MDVKSRMTRLGGRGLLQAQKYSPQALTAIGIVGGVTATVLAVRAAVKLNEKRDTKNADIELIEDGMSRGDYSDVKEYTKAKAKVHTDYALTVCKAYGPAFGIGMASIAALVGAQGIQQKRQAGLVAAYAVLEKTVENFRTRVRDELGEEKEFELYHGVELEKGKDAEGNASVGIKELPKELSSYAILFDEKSHLWSPQPSYNSSTLRMVERHLNDKLKAQGHLFLNEVHDALDIPRMPYGQVVGWLYDYAQTGDVSVNLGLDRFDVESVRMFANGEERSIWLEPNVQGTIFNKI